MSDDWSVAGHKAFFSRQKPSAAVLTAQQELFHAAVWAAEQCQRQGYPINQETLCMVSAKINPRQALELLKAPKFLNALRERGIALPEHDGLSPEQMYALSIYMDMSVSMTHAQKLRSAGVTDKKWQGWRQQLPFAARLSELSEDRLAASTPLALQRVAEGVDRGDKAFVELALELTGRHDRRKETVDVNKILMQVFNILDEEIMDVTTLQRVAERMKKARDAGLLGGQAPTMQITPVGASPSAPVPLESRQTDPD